MMLAVHAGYAALLPVVQRRPSARKAAMIVPGGAGAMDGSSWADAAPLTAMDAMVTRAAAIGGDVWVRADLGPYAQNGNIPITHGGTAQRRVTIRGVDGNGQSMAARIVGARANPWTKGAADGAEVFRLRSGADHLGFAFLRFEDQGYGCIRSQQPHSDLLIEDCSFANVRAFYENGSSGHGIDATISGFTMQRCTGMGWSKHFARFRYASHDILIEDCTGDSLEQDGDNFCNGIVLEGSESVGLAPDGLPNGVHDVIMRRCSMGNCRDTLNFYQNGDAFGSEGQDYNVLFEDCHGWGCSDAAFDCKSRNTRFVRCSADDCKRGFRIWGDAVAVDCVVTNPRKRGGTGAAACISTFKKGYFRWYGGRFEQTGTNSVIVAEDGGFTAYTPRTVIIKPADAPLSRVEANSIVTEIDEADTTPPALVKSTYTIKTIAGTTSYDIAPGATFDLQENRILNAVITTTKPATTRIVHAQDYAAYTATGQTWTILRQDYENDRSVGQDQTYRVPLRLYDANGNFADTPLAGHILNVDDNPIGPADLKASGVTAGAWWEVQDRSTLFLDRAGQVPVSAWADDGDPIIRRVNDKLFANHLVVPDDSMGFYLRHDDLGSYWLEPYTAGSFFLIGAAGALQFAKFTASLGIYREPGEAGPHCLISVPRSMTIPTATNATWWMVVRDGQSFIIRLPASGNSGTSTGNFGMQGAPLVLSLLSEPGLARSNAVDCLDVADNAAVTYPAALANARARLLADGNAGQTFNGRFYGGVVTNRTESDDFRFRIERQIAEWAGVAL
ncbi:hypothetical protein [Sphingomonas panni]|uniref:hypothetical protein n=1 Tax=Sphingomonas panni TaxID=237612 RepID=UPI001F5B6995|nr:hypothetical protein [Sphingomonas panni]